MQALNESRLAVPAGPCTLHIAMLEVGQRLSTAALLRIWGHYSERAALQNGTAHGY